MDAAVLEDYFSEEKTAHDLGVTVDTLRNWSVRREGPPRTKVARRVYYRKDAMQQWLLAREQNPEAALNAVGVSSGHASNGEGAGV